MLRGQWHKTETETVATLPLPTQDAEVVGHDRPTGRDNCDNENCQALRPDKTDLSPQTAARICVKLPTFVWFTNTFSSETAKPLQRMRHMKMASVCVVWWLDCSVTSGLSKQSMKWIARKPRNRTTNLYVVYIWLYLNMLLVSFS